MKYLLIIVGLGLTYFNLHNLNIAFLSLHNLDEYAFFGSLMTMYEGILNLNPKQFFAFGFYNYGVIFFFGNLIVSLPGLLLKKSALTIFLPRMLTSFFALFSLIYISKISSKYLNKKNSYLLLTLAVTMPAFWLNAAWFHPDWIMTSFLILCVYFFQQDNFKYKRNFWLGILFFSLALSTKLQALTFYPLIFLYVFALQISQKSLKNLAMQIKTFLKAIGTSILFFIITNPYLLHPLGFQTFWNFFLDNLDSNATNHGSNYLPTLSDKILTMFDTCYLPIFLFIPFSIIVLYWSLQYFRKNKKENLFFGTIALTTLINYVYFFFFVNKNWQHYYLATFFLSFLILIPFFKKFKTKTQSIVLLCIVSLSLLFHFSDYQTKFKQHLQIPETTLKKATVESNSLVEILKNQTNSTSQILISPKTSFEYEKLGISFQNIHIIYGPLQEYMFNETLCVQKYKMKINKCNPKDFIILKKDDIYFNQDKLNHKTDQESYLNAIEIINDLQEGRRNYKLFSENDYFYIWQKQT